MTTELNLPPRGSRLRTTDTGLEKLCVKCIEWWPADLEFFYADAKGGGGLYQYCKACYLEHVRPNAARRILPVIAPASITAELAAMRVCS